MEQKQLNLETILKIIILIDNQLQIPKDQIQDKMLINLLPIN